MAKLNSREVLHILRLFDLATPGDVPRSVTSLKVIELTLSVTASFIFKSYNFFLLFDEDIADSEKNIKDTLGISFPGIDLQIISNPRDDDLSYGMPYKGKTVYLAQVDIKKQRLDILLVKKHPDLSRSTIQKYIKEGYVKVEGEKVTTPKQLLLPSSNITLDLPKKDTFADQTIPILYEDDNVLVMDKPQGLLTHSKGVLNDEFTVADFLARYYSDDLTTERPGIVHRLDRDTSGVIIGAKNAETAKHLRRQFSDRKVKKTYYAVLDGVPKQDRAILDLPIARNMNNPSTFKVDAKGKYATTEYEVLEHLPDSKTFVQFNPITGRTHQLRVHAKYINAPIKGDRVYGTQGDRMYLHAGALEITIPGGKRMVFESSLPPGFK